MNTLRLFVCTAGLLLALAPAATMAASPQELAAKRQANIVNDVARCTLAAQGVKLPGKIAPSTPEAAAGCAAGASGVASGEFRALQLLPAGTKVKCLAPGGQLTKVQKAVLFDYLIAKVKAEGKNKEAPVPSEEILGLLACS